MVGDGEDSALPLPKAGGDRGVGPRFRLDRPTEKARALRNNPTAAEELLWSRLRKSQLGGLTFMRQIPVAGYFGDFGCRKAKLVVELDGSQHLDSAADEERTRRIESEGYRVIRFWNNDLTPNMEGVLQTILAAAFPNGERAPTPQPPPASERGSRTRASRTARSRRRSDGPTGASPPASGRGSRGGPAPSSIDESGGQP